MFIGWKSKKKLFMLVSQEIDYDPQQTFGLELYIRAREIA